MSAIWHLYLDNRTADLANMIDILAHRGQMAQNMELWTYRYRASNALDDTRISLELCLWSTKLVTLRSQPTPALIIG